MKEIIKFIGVCACIAIIAFAIYYKPEELALSPFRYWLIIGAAGVFVGMSVLVISKRLHSAGEIFLFICFGIVGGFFTPLIVMMALVLGGDKNDPPCTINTSL